MSWNDTITNSVFSILTGDEKEYFPLIKFGSKVKEFNASIFEFIDKEKSFVNKKKPRSGNFNLLFYFQGDDHLEISEAFENSSDDTRFWIVKHPIFGTIKGQPISMERVETSLGISEFSVDFWETIEGGYLKKISSPINDIEESKEDLFDKNSIAYGSNIEVEAADQNKTKAFINKVNSRIQQVLSNEFYNDYQSVLSEALNYADDMILKPVETIKSINRLMDIPNNLNQSVKFRGRLMESIWGDVKSIFNRFSTKNDKSFIESIGAAVVSSVSIATITPLQKDYITSRDTLESAYFLNNLYNDYIKTLDKFKATSVSETHVLDFETQYILKSIVSNSVFNVFSIAFKAKQERIIELEKDSNLIILTHRFLRLDTDDNNLENFRQMNNIINEKVFKVEKGTKITYLV